VEFVPAIVAVATVIVGGIVPVVRDRMWLRHYRYLHDQAVARGQDPDPVQLTQASRAGRLQQAAE
jgi:hypothetical protein